MTMELQSLHVHKRNYPEPTHYMITANFEGESGKVELKVPREFGRQIIAICTDAMNDAIKEVSDNFKAEILENELQPTLIEDNTGDPGDPVDAIDSLTEVDSALEEIAEMKPDEEEDNVNT